MWLVKFLISSIGKKWIMAVTGLFLLLFLCSHAAGNATIYLGSELFQAYADNLHSHPLIVMVASTGMLFLFSLHICCGLLLFYENRQARPTKYAVSARAVVNSLASQTMPYTGIFIFIFLVVHLFGFTFTGKEIPISIRVTNLLSNAGYGSFYLLSFLVLALHLSHGVWSMLQTFGLNHPRYNTFIIRLTYVVPIFFLIIFGGIPLILLGANFY